DIVNVWQGKRSAADYLEGNQASKSNRGELIRGEHLDERSRLSENIYTKSVRTGTQFATDMIRVIEFRELYSRGHVEAKKKGLTGKAADVYAEAFMFNPTKEAKVAAQQKFLESSFMH